MTDAMTGCGFFVKAVFTPALAGAEKSAAAQVPTRGNVSLALSGKGEGWNLGVAFGALVIE